eukprot:scaffold9342_cov163-Cylindrotheca_fusiformis.AAC.4
MPRNPRKSSTPFSIQPLTLYHIQLEERWYLEDPSFTYTGNTFILTYQFSRYLDGSPEQTYSQLYLYRDKENPNSAFNCKQQQQRSNNTTTTTPNNEYTGSSLNLVESGIISSGATEYRTSRQETVIITMDTLGISQESEVFTDGNGEARIDFCVRFGLFTGDYRDEQNFEVNFLETLVTLFVDLRGSFTVTDISVAPKEKLLRTANIEYGLEAFTCSGKTAEGGIPLPGSVPFRQGDVISVCVQPTVEALVDNVDMRQVEFFEYILMEIDGVTESSTGQLAIDIENPAAGPRGTMHGLTNMEPCQGQVTCMIQTILFASFFSRQGTITGRGSATMQLGNTESNLVRKLIGHHRSLDEEEEETEVVDGDFGLEFNVQSTAYDPFLLRNRSGSVTTASSRQQRMLMTLVLVLITLHLLVV